MQIDFVDGLRRAVRDLPDFVGPLLTAVPAVFGRPLTRPCLTYHNTSIHVNVFLSIKVTDQSIPSKTRSRSCSFTQRYISRQNTPTKYRLLTRFSRKYLVGHLLATH